jgi:hypothetical protein
MAIDTTRPARRWLETRLEDVDDILQRVDV